MFCIGIYIRCRSCYNFLSKYRLCPSTNTLDTQLRHISLDTGCNSIVFKYLNSVAKELNMQDLNIALIWDEMSLKPAVYYDSTDKIIGFEDWGVRRTRKFADHAITFYIRCLASGNYMPIGYGFSNNITSTAQLARCVKEWLTHLIRSGFKPVVTVCDQGRTDIACINALIQYANEKRHIEHKRPSEYHISNIIYRVSSKYLLTFS